MNLVRIGHWEKELDGKIEEKRAELKSNKEKMAVAARTALSDKQKKLAEAKADNSEKEDMIKRLQGEINDLVVQRKINLSEKMSDIKAEKSKNRDMIKRLQKEINTLAMKRKIVMSEKMADMNAAKSMEGDTIKNKKKRNTEINSSIKVIKSEIDFLIKTRKELVSKRNETKNIVIAGELISVIIDGYDQLAKLRQEVNHNNDLILQARRGIQKLDAGIRSLNVDTGVAQIEVKVINDRIGQARLDIEELDAGIEKLKKESGVKPSEIEALNDKIAQARLDIEEFESAEKESRDELAVSDSTEQPDSDLKDTTKKAKNQGLLIEEEIGLLEVTKKKVKNIMLLQAPTSGVSPLTPNTRRNVVIGAVVGLFLSLFLSVFLEYVYKKDGGRGELNR